MKSLDPSCKLIGLLLPTCILAFTHMPILNMAIFLMCLLTMLFSRVNYKLLGILMIPVFITAISLFFTGYHFQNGSDEHITSLMGNGAIDNGLQLAGRVLVFAGLGLLFILTTDKMKMVRSMEQHLRLPEMFAFAIMATWGMLPGMRMEYKKTKLAFRARGIHTFSASPKFLKPLLVKSVRWSEALAAAMESKGFAPKTGRTRYYATKLRAFDIAFPIITCGALIGYLVFAKFFM